MTYSKLFLGNLPELTYEIIQYFRNDFSTLYSCILVNRLWCRLAIPLLWEDPFSIHVQNFQFIEIYLSNLKEDDYLKQKLVNIVDMELIASCSSTLFNYPSFIKRLNTHKVVYSIENWLMDDKHWEISILIYRSLFKMFIENEGNLHSFEVEVRTSNDCDYLNDTMELTLQNPNFTCNIRNLMFYIDIMNMIYTNIFPLLKFLCSNCNSISSLYIGIFLIYDKFEADNCTLVEKWLTQMINTQQNLKKISFEQNNFLYYSFSLLKNSNISNTLKIITFYTIDFKEIITNIQEIFNHLNVIETIHIINCRSLNSDFVQQINNILRPFKLKSLIMSEVLLNVELLQLLIQKFGSDLENFGFGDHYKLSIQKKQQLFESIIKYCRKIKYFSLMESDYINLALDLIENIKQNLNYLDIKFDFDKSCYDDSSIIISKNLGQTLPSKLEFLKLDLNKIKPSKLKIFLENFQNTFIKKLFIKITVQEKVKDILPYIKEVKEYIMKKKRVKYLAILINCKDLVSLKDEVKEFELYNIKIQYYDISYIKVIDIVNN
ncbi:hypothetical protein RhiirA1_469577 [Rhizophagus irregularis]|uniref:Uncharacterized protein n=1 Tax=Rhizophagus irregularis TaxID=588596 RepID=A0A2I1DSN0_9GLOM|nr:hypothetical protein RhiirA1_469577 [Rhizophagus irregularis]PKY12894.1 hypothetical protein RhiirB3_424615 [Rhizophagus irregularis]